MRRLILAFTASVIAAAFTAAPAAAGQVDGTVILLVTDCQTGAPIHGGEADFAIVKKLATAVAPIQSDGQVGPVGLGQEKFDVVVTSPGYRETRFVVHSAGDFSQVQTIPVCLHRVAKSPESLLTASYPISITCASISDGVCDPAFTTSIVSNNVAQLQFTASPANCSSIVVAMSVDAPTFVSDPLAPGDSTPVVADFTPVSPGTHAVAVQASGLDAGCTSWAGTLTVTTAMPFGPSSREVCKDGGWRFFTSPVFGSEGQCVRFASTAGAGA